MKQYTLNWLSFSLFFFLIFSCKKKDDFLPLKSGKYLIDYQVVKSNGDIDNYQYTAYGPKTSGAYYKFMIKATDSTNFSLASLSTSERKLKSMAWINYSGNVDVSRKITEYDCSENNLIIHYTSFPLSDTTSGTIIFTSIE
ncbi:hypothetical protein [Fluviicola taffensis]|uniref:Lipocalin-like domain-containing protein n=1 Tax=Fluviicola taffensis (strain DSM 16823 / NCIMB 13979 / RW262) TaxID=755732 RepID=F2IIY2_FLUTR|nr:hypothetical protein [Fluviicola taffensis]AEA43840.1 hypothetical protein Fluta_1853 [Fluviicola taffensis DSM 16823]